MKRTLKHLGLTLLSGALLATTHTSTAAGPNHGRHLVYQPKPQCIHYQLKAKGGEAGIRFMHNIGNYHLVKGRTYHGRVCHPGPLRVELSRRHPGTKVVLKFEGKKYVFRPHEPAHRYINHWHRKYFTLGPGGHYRHHGYHPAYHDHGKGGHGYHHNYGHSYRYYPGGKG